MARTRKVSKQKKRNSWYLVYRPPGQTQPVWEPVGTDEETAELRRLEKVAALANPDFIQPSRDSFKSVTEEWWILVAVGRYAESTLADYRSIVDAHLLPAFGQLPSPKVRYKRIQQFISDKQAEGLSAKRIRNILNVLSAIFKHAVKAEYCRDNPVDKVERPPLERTEIDCLNPEEVWRLLAAVKEVQPFYYPLVLTALMTGMRLGELRSLTWSRADFPNKEIRVRTSQSRKQTKAPKTDAGWRTIPMSTMIHDVLLEQKSASIAGCDLVFPSRRLTPFDPANVRKRVLARSLEHAGLRHVTWHSIRHSSASLMAAAHASDKEVQMIMGHASIQVTKDLYTHLFDRAKVDAIDRMTEHLISQKPEDIKEERAEYGTYLVGQTPVIKLKMHAA